MKAYLYAAAALIITAGVVFLIHSQREAGKASERAKQEKANAEFRVRAAKGAVDFDTCDAAGGLFDFRKSTCKLP